MKDSEIPFLNLARLNAAYKRELLLAAEEVIDSGWYVLGGKLATFERNFSSYCGVEYSLGVGNGLDALRIIFRSYIEMGLLSAGDEVIVPANTYIASILAITDNALVPVFVEPDPVTYNLSCKNVSEKIGKKTRAILAVHLYGQLCDMDQLCDLAKSFDLLLVEDCAQAHGAARRGRKAGAWGDASGFSFFPGKNLGALGDAGIILTDQKELFEISGSLRNYGSKVRYINDHQGVNSRLDEIQAAFLDVKLQYLEKEISERRKISRVYRDEIKSPSVTLPVCSDEESHVWHQFVIRAERREDLQMFLKARGINTLIHYPIPPHKQKAYSQFNNLNLPVSESIHDSVLSLPVDPYMSASDIQRVVSAVNEYS